MTDTLLITTDGSHTILSERFGVTYHSKHGAIQESAHVFILSGLQYLFDKDIKEFHVFEMGFGTGLNALLSHLFAQKNNIVIHYTAVEKYPLTFEQYQALNYAPLLNVEPELLCKMHNSVTRSALSKNFDIEILHIDITTTQLPVDTYNLVYFDAFDPATQPDLWTEALFITIYNAMKSNAVLVTYSAKGQVRRNLHSAGFKVKRIPGPPGKREMLRGIK